MIRPIVDMTEYPSDRDGEQNNDQAGDQSVWICTRT